MARAIQTKTKRPSPVQMVKNLHALPSSKQTNVLVDLINANPAAGQFINESLPLSGKETETNLVKSRSYNKEYHVRVPGIEKEWDNEDGAPFTLKLAVSKKGHLWGKFRWNVIEGILRSSSCVSAGKSAKHRILPGTRTSFTWHGRETGEGEIITGEGDDDDTGELELCADGKVKGVLNCQHGVYEFEATPVQQRRVVTVRSVPRWKREFRSINEVTALYENETRYPGLLSPRKLPALSPEPSDSSGSDEHGGQADESMQ